MIDLWDVFQHVQIRNARQSASNAQRDAKHTNFQVNVEIARLESKIDNLALICEALVQILVERGGVTEREITEKITEIDLRDGLADGKFSGNPTRCPTCDRVAHTRQRTCMYCGTVIDGETLIDKAGRANY